MDVVLIVEDDPAIADITSMVLEDAGYEVLTASGDREAAQIVAARKDICVVLTDKNLNGVDGLSMVRRLRSEGMNAAVVIMSGDLSLSNEELGDITFLAKPYDMAELRQAIADACARYRHS